MDIVLAWTSNIKPARHGVFADADILSLDDFGQDSLNLLLLRLFEIYSVVMANIYANDRKSVLFLCCNQVNIKLY